MEQARGARPPTQSFSRPPFEECCQQPPRGRWAKRAGRQVANVPLHCVPPPREAERFEEGIEPEFQDVDEGETGEAEGSGVPHGGFGSATLHECLDRINQSRTDAPAPCHSGVKSDESSIPPQVMSPSVEEEQTHDTTSVKRPSQHDEPQPRVKEERKDEDTTPKSEAATDGTKDEPTEHDSEDSLRPEQMRGTSPFTEFPPSAESAPAKLDEQKAGPSPEYT